MIRIATAVVVVEVQKLKDRETVSRTALEAMTCKKSDRWQLKRCFRFMQVLALCGGWQTC